jgi:tRNA wybutosine-synthesizing protein 2
MKMLRFKELLHNKLRGILGKKELKLLPKGFQRIGDIILIHLHSALHSKAKLIGKVILETYEVRTVCLKEFIRGPYRKPSVKVIAGDEHTETVYKENGCEFKIDVKEVMLAMGNVEERARLIPLVEKDEIIFDMFAGIGYFTMPLARWSKAKKIFAIDFNPFAIKYLVLNIRRNGVENKVFPILGDSPQILPSLRSRADRIIMGLLAHTHRFLPAAFKALEDGGIIHYHDVYHKKEMQSLPIQTLEEYANKHGFKLEKILYHKKVKKFAPNLFHIVVDACFKKV